MKTVLLIDDDASLLRVTEYNLSQAGFTVFAASSGLEGLVAFHKVQPDIVVTDVQLGDVDGLDVLKQIKQEQPDIPVIIITAFGSIELAVRAMELGAFTFIAKPFDRNALRLSCIKALEMHNLHRRTRNLTEEINRLTGAAGMETVNTAMAELLQTALKVAESTATVLITGESGTGKEVLARLIHRRSPRRKEPFIGLNCAAIPKNLIESELFGHVKGAFTGAITDRQGRFQRAERGTLFLDEIGDLQPDMQVKFLRVLQEKKVEAVGGQQEEEVDVRIIAATNRNLQDAIAKGYFREDLYYRLSVIPLHLPPLRERKDDIPALVCHFLKKHDAPAEVSFSPEGLQKLQDYDWPGNIRELQNVVERSIILRSGPKINAQDILLPHGEQQNSTGKFQLPPGGVSLEAVEKTLIEQALSQAEGNRSQAARLLQIPRHVLIYRLEKFAIAL
ncbi:MAG: sigma-54 dependent transcriptional regulator [Proteobacteria bacterium]|nr:sigma-54 dependent transcriptional regulator [Pseudomonadota bacterium]MBU1057207.1 sigma-54 dependent transcriptional regulator [Pseudomonadota bacterium]